jgi:diguanylate cyclase (GGDEF)-like protein
LVLRQVAQTLRHHCRGSDLVARYGGEEFAVLLPETGLEEAWQAAERLCAAVRRLRFAHPLGPFQVTLSFGLAAVQGDHPHSLPALVERADTALYAAKRNGRDRVEGDPEGCCNKPGLPPFPA